MLIKIENGQPVGYPVLEDNFRYLYPGTVFPLVLTKEIVEPYGYAMYEFSQQPNTTWNQKLVETTPAKDQFGTWRQQWQVVNLSGDELTQQVVKHKDELILQIDRDVDRIYSKTIGARATEYLLTESEAKAYAAANFEGPVPETVQGWATIKGWPTKEAAEAMIREADFWRYIQIQLRQARLETKEKTRTTDNPEMLDTLMDQWNSFVTAMLAQLV